LPSSLERGPNWAAFTGNAMNSTIMTAPSIIIPKSIAPKHQVSINSKIFINEIANNRHNGITEATTNPDRQFPSNKTTTIRQPKIRFSATVKVVLPTNTTF
jgi:hypothetical protein